jgi:methylmalonyl-CoA/ethylmalonyl-CoA epimerase
MPASGLIVLELCTVATARLNARRNAPTLWRSTQLGEAAMALLKVGQIAMSVSDADRAEQFYGETLGLHKLYRFGELVFFSCDGIRLMLEGTSRKIEPAQGTCIYFTVKDIDAVTDKLKSKSVPFDGTPHLVAKMSDHELWMAFFRDPDGHLLALMEEKR